MQVLNILVFSCRYIDIISKINVLYEKDLSIARELARSSSIVDVMNTLFRYPIITAKQVAEMTNIPPTSVSRYLSLLADNKILVTDNKSRNRTYYYYEFLDILR